MHGFVRQRSVADPRGLPRRICNQLAVDHAEYVSEVEALGLHRSPRVEKDWSNVPRYSLPGAGLIAPQNVSVPDIDTKSSKPRSLRDLSLPAAVRPRDLKWSQGALSIDAPHKQDGLRLTVLRTIKC
jgi:hypothetical protein